MSGLRQLLNGHGPALVRRGGGVCPRARRCDPRCKAFSSRSGAKDVSHAAGGGRARARRDDRPGSALGLWRGSAPSRTSSSDPLGRADAERSRGAPAPDVRAQCLDAELAARAARARTWASFRRLSQSTPTVSASSRSSCSRSTGSGRHAAGARGLRAAHADAWTTISGSSRARTCSSSRHGSSGRSRTFRAPAGAGVGAGRRPHESARTEQGACRF